MKRAMWFLIVLSGCSFGRGGAPQIPVVVEVAPYSYPGDAVVLAAVGSDARSVAFTLSNPRNGRSLVRDVLLQPGASTSVALDAAALETLVASGDLTPLEAHVTVDNAQVTTGFALLGDRGIQLPGDHRIVLGTVPGHASPWQNEASTASSDAAFRTLVESWHGTQASISARVASRSDVRRSDAIPESTILLRYRATGVFPRVVVPASFTPSKTDQVCIPGAIEAILPQTQSPALLDLLVIPQE